MSNLYAQTSGTLTTKSDHFTPIPGLKLTLPKGVDVIALVTLNLPNPFAEGNNFPGAMLGISVNGTISPVQASFTYGVPQPQSANRMPTTLIVGLPLTLNPQEVVALWYGVRGSTVIIDSPSSLSVIY
jgi:mannose-binding lectin